MNAELQPTSLRELAEAVQSAPRVIAVGGRTKPRLSLVEAVPISTRQLRGILEYDPSEFTFTALAGTPLREITAALAERGQYLPFDPFWLDAGSTIGGAVASGLSGPGRLRYGGARDFILGVGLVDGGGRLLRFGGKVVKNAAGFDVPKFVVGSLGRFGAIAEVTFKVFPRPPAIRTLRLEFADWEEAARIVSELARSRWEPDAIDLPPNSRSMLVRLAGPDSALASFAAEILKKFRGETLDGRAQNSPGSRDHESSGANSKGGSALAPGAAEVAGQGPATAPEGGRDSPDDPWLALREFGWAHPDGILLKVPLTLDLLPPLGRAASSIAGHRVHFSAAGDVAYLSLPDTSTLPNVTAALERLNLAALTLRGAAPLTLGAGARPQIHSALKLAFDPQRRFPDFDL